MKLDQPKSAIVFSYDDKQAYLQIFTSLLSVLANVVYCNLHRNTLSCLCTMQQYFCEATEPAGPGANHLSLRALKAPRLLCF